MNSSSPLPLSQVANSTQSKAVFHLSPESAARIDRLIASRVGSLKLPRDLMKMYVTRTASSGQLTLASWSLWVASFGFISLLLGYASLPPQLHALGIIFSSIVTLTFLVTSQLIRLRIAEMFRDQMLTGAVGLTVILSLTNGWISGNPTTFLIYELMSVALAWSFITFVQTRFLFSLAGAAMTIILLAFYTLAAPLPNLAEKLLLLAFLVITTAGMANARRVQNLYLYRLFLLQLRDEHRSAQMEALNAELASLAYTDRLTDIPNRRFFDERIAALSATPETALPLAICLLDIDHFKNLNDRLGHIQGDRCLQMVATTLRDTLRNSAGEVARYGGEEFVVILPRTQRHAATQLVEDLRQAVQALHHPNPETSTGFVTISAGIAVAEQGAITAQDLLAQADHALYRAKSAGRNQVVA
jgi:diguanylate cyclase (GGDEF)-like protein